MLSVKQGSNEFHFFDSLVLTQPGIEPQSPQTTGEHSSRKQNKISKKIKTWIVILVFQTLFSEKLTEKNDYKRFFSPMNGFDGHL